MLFGHNTNVSVGENTYHVQTEDRGTASALIDTTVYCGGRVLHRRANNYFDLLPLTPDTEEALKLRLDEQHRITVEDIRTGALHLAHPPAPAPPKPAPATPASAEPSPPAPAQSTAAAESGLALELTNARSWLSGKRATLQIAVRGQDGKSIAGAKVAARIEGAAEPSGYTTESGAQGHAHLEFEMPRLAGPEVALVIEATHAAAKGQIKFQLRSKPRVPAAS